MDEAQWTLIDIVGPAILLVLLVWVVLKTRTGRNKDDSATKTDTTAETERATRENYAAEEQRRRDGTDGL